MSIYLKIDQVQGGITAAGHEGSIHVLNYHVRHFRPLTQRTGVNADRLLGVHDRSTLVLSKNVDDATPPLLSRYYKGSVIPEVVFQHLTTGDQPQCYLENTFKHVLVTSYEEFCTPDGVSEQIELAFTSQEKRVMLLTNEHQPSSPQSVGYDYASMELT